MILHGSVLMRSYEHREFFPIPENIFLYCLILYDFSDAAVSKLL